jgi:outer membrane protein assembly factor BamB
VLTAIAYPVSAGSASEWRQYGFNARHSLFNPSENILNRSNVSDASLQWEFVTGNGTGIAPFSGPALSDGVLYIGTYAQTIFTALDAETGATRWVYTGTSFFSDPAVGGGKVYTASLDGNLYAFPTDCVGAVRQSGACQSAPWEPTHLQPWPTATSTSEATMVGFMPSMQPMVRNSGRQRSIRLRRIRLISRRQ